MSSGINTHAHEDKSTQSKAKFKTLVLANLLLLASAMVTSGCMLTPGDGQNIGAESSLIYFSGYTTKPNTRVYVRARDSLDSQWIHLGTTYSSSTPLTLDGLTGYPWNAQLTIPQSAWSGCGSNRYATVRAHAYQGTLSSDHTPITIVADGAGCWIRNPNWGSFLNNCIAENTPDAIIYSNDGPACCTPTGVGEAVCNGVDDDCDGQVDEDYAPIVTTCGPGGCNSGVTSCVSGQVVDSCDPVCGPICTPTGVSETICNGVDDDCDGSFDEDYPTQVTTCGPGGCASGVLSCVSGQVFDNCNPNCGGGGTGGSGGTGGTAGTGGTPAGETITYYDVDPLGSPVAATDSQGNIVWRAGYEPFGHRLDDTVGPDNPLWFTGAAQEPISQLIDLGSRHYNPAIGRFYGFDPVDFREGDPHSFNRYAYANNNPYRYIDPSGDIPVETIWDVVNIGIGVGSFVNNIRAGNYFDAAVDAVGVVIDTGAAVIPYIPGGVGTAIKVKRGADVLDAATDAARYGDEVADVARGGTYKLRDPATGQVRRTGKTNDLNRRKNEHARGKETKDLDFEVDRRSDNEIARRGREQRIHDAHPEADLNRRRPISPNNKRRDEYLRAGDKL